MQNLAREIAGIVTLHSRKARNKHVNQLREVFFQASSRCQIAHNVIADQIHSPEGTVREMKLIPALSHLTVQGLCNLLKSTELHADPVFYPIFVSGLGLGKLSKIKKQHDHTPLGDFISVNYESHFRVELWFCLNKQGVCLFLFLV